MNRTWIKRGLIYQPSGDWEWAKTHAMLPTPELIGDKIRIYIGCCDEKMRSRIGYIDVDAANPSHVLHVAEQPILDIGDHGTFDENGVAPTCILNLENGDKYLYYVGFELGTKIRYRLLSGLAISKDGGQSFQKIKRTPILERTENELFFRCGPYVLKDKHAFKIWYVAGSHWTTINDQTYPLYTIKYLESANGIDWASEGKVCFHPQFENEYSFGRPYVVKHNTHYEMYYSIRTRHRGYCLGYATSQDGIAWERKDHALGLSLSNEGWDSQSLCYTALIQYKENVYLFYNGNDFGKTGFGYATLE